MYGKVLVLLCAAGVASAASIIQPAYTAQTASYTNQLGVPYVPATIVSKIVPNQVAVNPVTGYVAPNSGYSNVVVSAGTPLSVPSPLIRNINGQYYQIVSQAVANPSTRNIVNGQLVSLNPPGLTYASNLGNSARVVVSPNGVVTPVATAYAGPTGSLSYANSPLVNYNPAFSRIAVSSDGVSYQLVK